MLIPGAEVVMKQRQWKVSRSVIPHPQALARWDQVYQLLLECSVALSTAHFTQAVHQHKYDEEVNFHEDWGLCQGLELAADPNSNDRTTVGASHSSLSRSALGVE